MSIRTNLDSKAKVARNTWVTSIGSFFTSLFGLLSFFLVAFFFGAKRETDAFFAANVLFMFFSVFLSTLRYSVVPLMANFESKEKLFLLFNKVTIPILSMVIGISAVVFILSPQISSLLGTGFDSQTLLKTSSFIRIIAFTGFFQGLGFLCASALGTMGNFSVPAYSYAFGNFIWLCSILFLRNLWGMNSVVIGMLASSIFSSLTQLFYLVKIGYRPKISGSKNSGLSSLYILKTMILGSGIYVTANLNYAIGQSLSSHFPQGSATLFAYAATGTGLLIAVISYPISLVIIPSLSRIKDDKHMFSKTLSLGIRYNIIFIMPLAFFLSFFRIPILRFFLASSLRNQDINILGNMILGYSVLVLAYSLDLVLFSAFYSMGKQNFLIFIGLLSIPVNLIASFLGKYYFGLTGLAIAQSVYTTFILIVLLFKLTGYVEKGIFINNVKGLGRISFFAFFSSLTVYFIIHKYFDLSFFIPLLSAMFLSMSLYLILIFIFQPNDIKFFWSTFTNKEF